MTDIPSISSVHNPRVKLVRSLKSGRQRKEQGLMLLEGRKHIGEAFNAGAQIEEYFYIPDNLSPEDVSFVEELKAQGVRNTTVNERVLTAMADTSTPQGMVAVAKTPVEAGPALLETKGIVLVADAVSDPGNVGTMLRTAAAVGAGLILTAGCADVTGPKVARATAGALFSVPLWTRSPASDIAEALKRWGYSVVVTAVDASGSYFEIDYCGPVALVIGNEAHGVSTAWAQNSDRVSIPMPGRVESLNAGVAAALILYEALRQRLYQK